MGRKLAFDREEALTLAMESFWANGFEAMSMRNLAETLGIHLGSLYNALGDKTAMFEKALKLHLDTHTLPGIEALATAEDPLGALFDFFDGVARECGKPDDSPGCFLVNSLLEIASISERVTATLHGYLARIEQGFARCVANAVEKGQLPEKTNPEAAARFIVAGKFSLRVMGKLRMPQDHIDALKGSILKALSSGI